MTDDTLPESEQARAILAAIRTLEAAGIDVTFDVATIEPTIPRPVLLMKLGHDTPTDRDKFVHHLTAALRCRLSAQSALKAVLQAKAQR